MGYSTDISIVYFALNVFLLISLSVLVYKTRGYDKLFKLTPFLKDVWSHKGIFAPVLIHFYDTATDIGVLFSWYILMKKQQYGADYGDVNMTAFFLCGFACLLLYRFGFLFYSIGMGWFQDERNKKDWLLVFFDLYIFKAVYFSFKSSGSWTNEEEEPENDKEKERVQHHTQTNNEIGPSEIQYTLQLTECILESVPQIVLQSVYIVKSMSVNALQNTLETNYTLLIFSIVASLFSISGKFAWKDREVVVEKAASLKPKKECLCIQHWFMWRVMWRISHVMNRFVVLVLMWAVVGGFYLTIWFLFVFIMIGVTKGGCNQNWGVCIVSTMVNVIGVDLDAILRLHALKYIESVIGFIIIMIFATSEFECAGCAEVESRQMINDRKDDEIIIFSIMGGCSLVLEIVLYISMRLNSIIKFKSS
eukprot:247323_1